MAGAYSATTMHPLRPPVLEKSAHDHGHGSPHPDSHPSRTRRPRRVSDPTRNFFVPLAFAVPDTMPDFDNLSPFGREPFDLFQV